MLLRLLVAGMMLSGCYTCVGGYGSCVDFVDAGAAQPGPDGLYDQTLCDQVCPKSCPQLNCDTRQCDVGDAGLMRCAHSCLYK